MSTFLGHLPNTPARLSPHLFWPSAARTNSHPGTEHTNSGPVLPYTSSGPALSCNNSGPLLSRTNDDPGAIRTNSVPVLSAPILPWCYPHQFWPDVVCPCNFKPTIGGGEITLLPRTEQNQRTNHRMDSQHYRMKKKQTQQTQITESKRNKYIKQRLPNGKDRTSWKRQ